jgi:hypothetical protein
MRLLLVSLLLVVSSIAAPAVFLGAEPIRLHPENGHYFEWRGKPTILVTSGEHYGALLNLDFDFVRYLSALEKDGLNHTRVFSGTYREQRGGHGIADNTLAPEKGRYLSPWKRSDQPGYFHGGNKFDLREYDPEYFHRLRELLTEAEKRSIVVEFTLFCPLYTDGEWDVSPFNVRNNVNGIGNWPRDETMTLKHPEVVKVQEDFVRKVVRELNEFENLYYEICNEPYQRNVPADWELRMLEALREAQRDLPRRHLISLNVANGAKDVKTPPEGVSIFNFHYCVPPNAVKMNYGLNKLIGENETGFRGKHDFLYRSEGWDFLLAGGGLYNSLDYSFTVGHPAGDLREFQAPGGGSPELRVQLGVLKRFLEQFDFVRMIPDEETVRKLSDGLAARALSRRGEDYAIYVRVPIQKHPKKIEDFLRTGISAKLTLQLPTGMYRAEWINTLNGATEKTDEWEQASDDKELNSPKFDNDVAVRIRRIDSAKRD